MLLTLSSRFQSALPRGERLVSVQIVILQLKISIRAPARGATLPPFPHSRPYVISIRAPARGATNVGICKHLTGVISIRAPARGATLLPGQYNQQYCISIRAPARGATIRGLDYWAMCDISIRAPARGATRLLEPLESV